MQEYKYSPTAIESMVPFERSITIDLLNEWIDNENKRIESLKNGN